VDLQDVAELVSEIKHCGPNTSGWDWRSSQSGDKCCNLSFDHQLPSGSLQWHFNAPPIILDPIVRKTKIQEDKTLCFGRERVGREEQIVCTRRYNTKKTLWRQEVIHKVRRLA
jgi:hypothetical protein